MTLRRGILAGRAGARDPRGIGAVLVVLALSVAAVLFAARRDGARATGAGPVEDERSRTDAHIPPPAPVQVADFSTSLP